MAGGRISKKEVVKLVKKFKKSGEKNNTKSVWFSLADIQEVISLINDLTDTSGGKKGDGVRLYFSRYPQNSKDAGKRNRNTIVFVPTYQLNGGSTHYDYISAEEVKELSQEIGDPDIASEEESSRASGPEGFNHGDLCPDQCNGVTVGDA